MANLPLTYVPVTYSEHVYLNGVEQQRDHWTFDATYNRIVTATAMAATSGDRLECRYAHEFVDPPTPPVTASDLFRISGNTAVGYIGGITWISDVGAIVTEVECTVSGSQWDSGFGFYKSPGFFLTAQLSNSGNRILQTLNGIDSNIGVLGSITTPVNLRMTGDWSTNSVSVYVNGVHRTTGTADPAVSSPRGVEIRNFPQGWPTPASGAGISSYDDLKINGVLYDTFTRDDRSGLGTATPGGGVWAE